MKILYGFSNCTDRLYNKIVSENSSSVLRPDQKYHGLLIKGLSKNGAKVECISGLPINRSVTKKIWIHESDEVEGNSRFHYYRTINCPGLRQMMIFCGAFFNGMKYKKTEDDYAICDCLNIANAYGMLLACKIRKIPIVTIVTDLPDMLSKNKILRVINNGLFKAVDGFIFLTEQMNSRLNRKGKPYIVMEGHVDSDALLSKETEKWEKENGKKVIIYAGGIRELYGISYLAKGFLEADIPNSELWIYGDGDFREKIIEIARNTPNIVYKGVCSNIEVVFAEMHAALLVNPRPSAPEYTKYSFPSKNMEYMVSGTPLLTTKLPGMPKEYYKYIYFINNETSDGIAKELRNILNTSFEEREALGKEARKFVLEKKNNLVQSEKIMRFLKEQVE